MQEGHPALPGQVSLAGFLLYLRRRKHAIGITQFLDVTKLLANWESSSVGELADAIAALLATSRKDVTAIRAHFDRYYGLLPVRPDGPVRSPEDLPPVASKRWVLVLGLLALLFFVGVPALWLTRPAAQPSEPDAAIVSYTDAGLEPDAARESRAEEPRPEPAKKPEKAGGGDPKKLAPNRAPATDCGENTKPVRGKPAAATEQGLCSLPDPTTVSLVGSPEEPPKLPPNPPQRWLALRHWLGGSGLLFLVVLLFGRRRIREARTEREQRRADRELADRPGPSLFQIEVKRHLTCFAPQELEEFAILFTRLSSNLPNGRREVDIQRTVLNAARTGQLIEVKYRNRARPALLILRDTSRETAAFAYKLDAFIEGLARRGVVFELFAFNKEADAPMNQQSGEAMALAALLRLHPATPALVLSSGSGARQPPEGGAARGRIACAPWVTELARHRRVEWLHPLDTAALWPDVLRDPGFPIRVWPMTRIGLRGAAEGLVNTQRRRVYEPERFHAALPLTDEGLHRLWRLSALVPRPSIALVEWLRQRFCKDVPEEALLVLMRRHGTASRHALNIEPAERKRLLRELRQKEPALEQQARNELLELITKSQPPSGSRAHLRWQLSCAEQILFRSERLVDGLARFRDLLDSAIRQEAATRLRLLYPVLAETLAEFRSEPALRTIVNHPFYRNGYTDKGSPAYLRLIASSWVVIQALLFCLPLLFLRQFLDEWQSAPLSYRLAYQLELRGTEFQVRALAGSSSEFESPVYVYRDRVEPREPLRFQNGVAKYDPLPCEGDHTLYVATKVSNNGVAHSAMLRFRCVEPRITTTRTSPVDPNPSRKGSLLVKLVADQGVELPDPGNVEVSVKRPTDKASQKIPLGKPVSLRAGDFELRVKIPEEPTERFYIVKVRANRRSIQEVRLSKQGTVKLPDGTLVLRIIQPKDVIEVEANDVFIDTKQRVIDYDRQRSEMRVALTPGYHAVEINTDYSSWQNTVIVKSGKETRKDVVMRRTRGIVELTAECLCSMDLDLKIPYSFRTRGTELQPPRCQGNMRQKHIVRFSGPQGLHSITINYLKPPSDVPVLQAKVDIKVQAGSSVFHTGPSVTTLPPGPSGTASPRR